MNSLRRVLRKSIVVRLIAAILVWGLLPLSILSQVLFAQGLRQQAEEKFGTDSKIWFAEAGDTGLGRWDAIDPSQEVGIILEWNSKNIVFVRPDATRETTITGDTVCRVEPTWTHPTGKEFHELFIKRQFTAAVKLGAEALKATGTPLWQQRLILAEMIEASMALGKVKIAGTLYVSLAKENAPQLLLSTIPLSWGNEQLDAQLPTMQPLAEDWVLSDNEAVQLLGAGWLLSGTKRTLAVETLKELTKSKSNWIAGYARCQLWRIVPPSEIQSGLLPKWITERDKIPFSMQVGPSMLLAFRMSQSGQPSLATSEWLRIASLHQDRYHFALKALDKAIETEMGLGRKDEATLVRQMREQYQANDPQPNSKK